MIESCARHAALSHLKPALQTRPSSARYRSSCPCVTSDQAEDRQHADMKQDTSAASELDMICIPVPAHHARAVSHNAVMLSNSSDAALTPEVFS